jgi:cellulose synthase operon protein C
MKAETVKRLAILIAVLSLIGGTGFYAHEVQIQKSARAEVQIADAAAAKGEFAKAQELYRLHLEVFPDDVDISIKYAGAILKANNLASPQGRAIGIYNRILRRMPGRDDVRRLLVQSKIDMGLFNSHPREDDGADSDVERLLKNFPHEGNLWFLNGRCQEEAIPLGKASDTAVKEAVEKVDQSYQKAIEYKAPQRIEAFRRRASLLRNRLDKPDEADRVIEAMVKASPDSYRVYLERGRYRLSLEAKNEDPPSRQSRLSKARTDFEQAKTLASREPEVYLELAQVAENESRYDDARQILEEGQKYVPESAAFYDKLVAIYRREQKIDEAVQILEDGLPKIEPARERVRLRVLLAELLARNGSTGKLLLQIEELTKAGLPSAQVDYLRACYYINMRDFVEARRLLTSIQRQAIRSASEFKSGINLLLAECYGHLGEPEKQRDAYLRAHGAASQDDPKARRKWIDYLVNQGKTEEAIKEYRTIVDQSPEVRLSFAQLLIARNELLPESQRDWSEVDRLINDAKKAAPESVEPVILEAECLALQGKSAVAQEKLKKEQGRNPNNVDLRIARAWLWRKEKGPEVAKALMDLAQNIEVFTKQEDRHRLLDALANELIRQQDLEGATRLRSQLAEQEPKNMQVHLNLLDLVFQLGRKNEIETTIKQIEKIEGDSGSNGPFCRARYLSWQASQPDTAPKTREDLRTRARLALNELKSRRPGWSRIPIALALLDEQELDQRGLKGEEKQAKEKSIIGNYLEAIQLGERSLPVLRRALLLLINNDRGAEALELLNRFPAESRLAGDLERQVGQLALNKGDFQSAERIARKAIEARPDVFSERLGLVSILLQARHQADAEAELLKAVDLSKTDPDRWVALVEFMVIIKQPEKAEKAIREAQANLPPLLAPLALARCCELAGKDRTNEVAAKWNGEAKEWYKKAEDAHPDDLSIKRSLTQFLLDTNQTAEAENRLKAMSKQGTAPEKAWAKYNLAKVYASGTDKERLRKALHLFEPNDRPAPIGQEGKALEDSDDLRVLARVLEAQKTVLQRKRAIEILESLADKNLAKPEDRLLLAELWELSGDWPKAREKYRELNAKTKILPDLEILSRRPDYLGRFIDRLLQNHKSGDEQNLIEAQELVDEIRQLKPDALTTLVYQVKISKARKQLDKAVELVRTFANRPNTTLQELEILASLAEQLDQFDLTEQLLKRREANPDDLRGKVLTAAFLGRHDRTKNALDICEPLWANPRNNKVVATLCIEILFGPSSPHSPDAVQLDRVSKWFETALVQAQAQNEPSTTSLLLAGLGNIRERQGRYPDAEVLYDRAIKQDDRDAVAYNNLAWLTALSDKNPPKALEYINRALALVPDHPEFLDTRGIAYLTAGDIPRAMSDLTKAVEIKPAPAKLFHLAQAHLAAKDKEKAKQYLNEARTKNGLTATDLHALERPAYEKMLNELGTP